LLTLFHLPPTDYKRFHAFLCQQKCNLPVAPYRELRGRRANTATSDVLVEGGGSARSWRSADADRPDSA
jgi:hypothetical protein